MARLNSLGHGRMEAPKLDPSIIIVRKDFNYRDITTEAVQKHIDWLEQSIRQNGVEKPITVEYTDGNVYLVDGQCRLEAVKRLKKKGLEIFIPSIGIDGDEANVLATSMIANGSLPPTVLEFGKAAARLKAYGWTEDEIAKYVPPHIGLTARKAKKYVSDAIELNAAPLAVKEAVAHGVDGVTVSPALAVQAVKKNKLLAEEQLKDAAKVAKERGKTTAKRPKGAGKATKAKESAKSLQEQLYALGDRIVDEIMAAVKEDGLNPHVSIRAKGAAQAWNQLRSR